MVLGEYRAVAGNIGFGGEADAGDVGIDPCRTFVHSPLLSDTGQYIFSLSGIGGGRQTERGGRQMPGIRCSGFLPSVMY